MHQLLIENQPLPPCRRLVVILPDADFDIQSLSKRIWELASPCDRQVLLIIKPSEEVNQFHVRLILTTLAALISDSHLVVQTQLVQDQSLVQAANLCARPDDILVCFEQHKIRDFLMKRPLADLLAESTQLSVYTLAGSISEMADQLMVRLIDILNLVFCFVSLIVFFALDVWIDRVSTGTLQSILLVLAVFAEVWIIGTLTSNSHQI